MTSTSRSSLGAIRGVLCRVLVAGTATILATGLLLAPTRTALAQPQQEDCSFGFSDHTLHGRDLAEWDDLISHRPPAEVSQHLWDNAWSVQPIEDGWGPISLDYYPIAIQELPVIDGHRVTAEEFLTYFRFHLNEFVDPDYTGWEPFNEGEALRWESADPLGSVIHVDMRMGLGKWGLGLDNPDDGAVTVTRYARDGWIFSTTKTLADGEHPVNGNRQFGFVQRAPADPTDPSAGEYIFFTRGADRPAGFLDNLTRPLPIQDAIWFFQRQIWTSLQERLSQFVEAHGGKAEIGTPSSVICDWSTIRKAHFHPATPTWTPPTAEVSTDPPSTLKIVGDAPVATGTEAGIDAPGALTGGEPQTIGRPGPGAGGSGSLFGDVHVRTFNDLLYDFQAVGEFVASKSRADSFEVQVRQEPWIWLSGRAATNVSIGTAVAANIAGDRIAIYARGRGPELRIAGEAKELDEGQRVPLSHGGQLAREDDRTYVLVWPDGTQVRTVLHRATQGGWMAISIALPQHRLGKVVGLLGNADGDAAGDFAPLDGAPLDPRAATSDNAEDTAASPLYQVFGNSWRIHQAQSLFDYDSGKDTTTYTDLSFPYGLATVRDEDRDAAEAICRAKGLTDQRFLDACILDVGLTGESDFAEDASWGESVPTNPAVVELPPQEPPVPVPAAPPAAPSSCPILSAEDVNDVLGIYDTGRGTERRVFNPGRFDQTSCFFTYGTRGVGNWAEASVFLLSPDAFGGLRPDAAECSNGLYHVRKANRVLDIAVVGAVGLDPCAKAARLASKALDHYDRWRDN